MRKSLSRNIVLVLLIILGAALIIVPAIFHESMPISMPILTSTGSSIITGVVVSFVFLKREGTMERERIEQDRKDFVVRIGNSVLNVKRMLFSQPGHANQVEGLLSYKIIPMSETMRMYISNLFDILREYANSHNFYKYLTCKEDVDHYRRASFLVQESLKGNCGWEAKIEEAISYLESIQILKDYGNKYKPNPLLDSRLDIDFK